MLTIQEITRQLLKYKHWTAKEPKGVWIRSDDLDELKASTDLLHFISLEQGPLTIYGLEVHEVFPTREGYYSPYDRKGEVLFDGKKFNRHNLCITLMCDKEIFKGNHCFEHQPIREKFV